MFVKDYEPVQGFRAEDFTSPRIGNYWAFTGVVYILAPMHSWEIGLGTKSKRPTFDYTKPENVSANESNSLLFKFFKPPNLLRMPPSPESSSGLDKDKFASGLSPPLPSPLTVLERSPPTGTTAFKVRVFKTLL